MNQLTLFIRKYRRIILALVVFLLFVTIQHLIRYGESMVGLMALVLFAGAGIYLLTTKVRNP